jgi:hypothetical protein
LERNTVGVTGNANFGRKFRSVGASVGRALFRPDRNRA